MKLKTRLIIGFMVVSVLPLILSITVIFGFWRFRVASFEKTYGITGEHYSILSNPVNSLNQMIEGTYQQLTIAANRDPDSLVDVLYLDEINEDLKAKNSYLLVRDNDHLLYVGSSEASKVSEVLPMYGEGNISSENGTYLGGRIQVLLKQIDFQTSD